MREFNFFKGYVYLGEIDLPMVRRMSGRTIAQDLVPIQPMGTPRGDLFYMEQPTINRLRWVEGNINGFRFSVYTYYNQAEVERITLQTIMPFLYEPNNPINRQRLLGLLQARFHRAYITN